MNEVFIELYVHGVIRRIYLCHVCQQMRVKTCIIQGLIFVSVIYPYQLILPISNVKLGTTKELKIIKVDFDRKSLV